MIYFIIIYCIGDSMITNENGVPLTPGNGGGIVWGTGGFLINGGNKSNPLAMSVII